MHTGMHQAVNALSCWKDVEIQVLLTCSFDGEERRLLSLSVAANET